MSDSANRGRRLLTYGALFTFRDAGTMKWALGAPVLRFAFGDFRAAFLLFAATSPWCELVPLVLKCWAEQRPEED